MLAIESIAFTHHRHAQVVDEQPCLHGVDAGPIAGC